MRAISHNNGKVKRGDGAPGDGGALYFVDTTESYAIVDGRLYLNGQPAAKGVHRITLDSGETIKVTVSVKGLATHVVEGRGAGV